MKDPSVFLYSLGQTLAVMALYPVGLVMTIAVVTFLGHTA